MALSYAAGSPRDTRRTLVNGYWLSAFRSLAKYIENLVIQVRPRGSLPLLWTDQTCTSQSADTEKGLQITFMRQILQAIREGFRHATLNQIDHATSNAT